MDVFFRIDLKSLVPSEEILFTRCVFPITFFLTLDYLDTVLYEQCVTLHYNKGLVK